jgi:hypothetical protein
VRRAQQSWNRDWQQARLQDRLLLFDLEQSHYALRAAAVHGLAECGPVRRVPGAPPSVLGLVEWRGHPLIVLDLPVLLGHGTPTGPPSLIRLASPLQGTALLLPVHARMASGPTLEAAAGRVETIEHEGRTIRLVDPAALVRRAEREIGEGRPA